MARREIIVAFASTTSRARWNVRLDVDTSQSPGVVCAGGQPDALPTTDRYRHHSLGASCAIVSTRVTPASTEATRCTWCGDDNLYVRYHDDEWGVPVHDDAALFELLTLEGAQAGLSWLTVLRRREGYRRVFENFDAEKVARLDAARVEAIMLDPGVIRHRQKIDSVVTNARAILELRARQEHASFADYVWALASTGADGPTSAAVMHRQLVRDGFKFVGPTICLSFMQASGMRNDHAPDCFRFDEIEASPTPLDEGRGRATRRIDDEL